MKHPYTGVCTSHAGAAWSTRLINSSPKENRIPPRLTIRAPADMATEIVPPLHKYLATQARAPAPACAPTEAPRIPRMFQIFGVENPRAKVRRENVCHREARVIQYCLIRVDGNAVRILDDDGLRYRVSDPAEYSLVLEQLRFCLFERVDVRAGYSNGYRVGYGDGHYQGCNRPHGALTADATQPAWNGYLLTPIRNN